MEHNTQYRSVFNSDFSETVAYNNPLFPAYLVSSFLSFSPDYSFVSHWHRDFEFILIKEGRMTYNVNGKLIELTEGSGIMVNSRQLHYGFSAEHNECEFICILLSLELLQANTWLCENCIDPITESAEYPYLYLNQQDWTASVLKELEDMYHSFCKVPAEEKSYFQLMEHYWKIMRLLYENLDLKSQSQKPEDSDLSCLKSMITYIEEHYMESVTLSDIALAGTCCKSKCSLLFKKYLRDTPITYTTKFRLCKSLSLLLDSTKNIAAIAYECGFGGASYYCETFKKYYGMSPLLYKKQSSMHEVQ